MFFTVMLTSLATRMPNSSDLIFSIAGDKGKQLLEIIRCSKKKLEKQISYHSAAKPIHKEDQKKYY